MVQFYLLIYNVFKMKKVFLSLLFVGTLILTMGSCQNESTSQELNKNSALTTLLMRVTHGGSSSTGKSGQSGSACFTVNLPVTLIDSAGQNVVVSDMADYNLVIDALRHSGHHDGDDDNGNDDGENNDDDHAHYTFVFPITLTMADATTLTVATQEELHNAVHSCHDDSDDINCLQLHYPITINYNDATNTSTTVTFTDDDDLYTFLITLIGSETLTINYPITITDSNGATVTIENNDQLQNAIQTADDHCGHHDGDDDHGGDGDDDNGNDDSNG